MKLVLIRGLPGSGKSTLAKSLQGFRHLEADQFFMGDDGVYRFDASKLKQAHQACLQQAELSLGCGYSVVVSNTFSRKWEMQPYLDMAKRWSVTPQIVECHGNFGNVHNVPEETISQMKARWEPYPFKE